MDNRSETAEKLRTQPMPEWVREMHREYNKTGVYSAKHLRKLLGDPTTRIDVGPKASAASSLSLKGD
jgi:hypothetical protein